MEASNTGGTDLERFNPFLPEFIDNPYSFYERYRARDPVHWGLPQSPGRPGCWYLFKYEDVSALLRDRRFVRRWPPAPKIPPEARPQPQSLFQEVCDRWLFSLDPPDHSRLRSLVNKAFSPRIVVELRPRIQELANGLLDRLGDSFDLVNDYAFPLSFTVIGDILGVRPEDTQDFRAWSMAVGDGINLRQGSEGLERANQGTQALLSYFRDRVAERRRQPRADLISSLIDARDAGEKLSEEELLAQCIQLIFAGHETTVNHIGNGMLALLQHPEQLALLRRCPELIDNAVNELLRFDSPVQTTAARKPMEDLELGGKLIRAGEPVIAFVGSANRDPAVFPEPDRLDITRSGAPHLTFGTGIHTCLAASLGRTEGAIALETLVRRRPGLRLTGEPLAWRPHAVLRGLPELRVHS
ncbi:cytochrome P450 [Archangium violaceum]|uniref:cytochrome P450 n=1 Tax=Archangium violaceum TaxID=83451 RepID=UPI002B28A348|nr:cytochrome P450 [Archangium violaceum]